MSDDRTPTEYLFLDALAGRWRTGERLWTFPRMPAIVKAARHIEALGLVLTAHGITEGTFRASLTSAGRDEVISATYSPPLRHAGIVTAANDDEFATLCVRASGYDAALEQVLRLHRPDFTRQARNWDDPALTWGPACENCIDENGCGAEAVRWPCETAEIILERLEAK